MRHARALRIGGCLGGALALLIVLLAGCAGGSAYSADPTRIAYGYLPTDAEVPSHPDSLATVAIVEKENNIDIEFDRSYERLMRDWSATWISQSAGRTFDASRSYRTFAILWSLDLSIASLAADEGVEGLSKDLAQERIDRRMEEHRQVLQIDLYRFVGSPPGGGVSSTLVGRPGSRVVLRDGQGNTYRPSRVENEPPAEAVIAGERALYRRNIFFFQREQDERDILDGVEQLRLVINESTSARYYFTWTFDDASLSSSS